MVWIDYKNVLQTWIQIDCLKMYKISSDEVIKFLKAGTKTNGPKDTVIDDYAQSFIERCCRQSVCIKTKKKWARQHWRLRRTISKKDSIKKNKERLLTTVSRDIPLGGGR